MAVYDIHKEPLVANKVNGRIFISLQEHNRKENSISCTVLPRRWSHGDHKTWLDCSKTRFRHTELLRAAEWDRGKVGENPATRSQPGAVAAWERGELLEESYR